MFSMPGINDYLNNAFKKIIAESKIGNTFKNNVTIISLETIFNFSIRGGDTNQLHKLADRYWKIIYNRQLNYKRTGSMHDYLQSKVSFDEIYETIYLKGFPRNPRDKVDKVTKEMIASIGLTQEVLDEIL